MATVQKYIEQIDGVWQKVMILAHTDNVYWQTITIIRENPDIRQSETFQEWLEHCYVRAMLVDIRSLVDDDRRSLSFVTFLRALSRDASRLFTRQWFVETHYHPNMRDSGNATFDKYFGPASQCVSKNSVLADIDALKKKLKAVVDYTNSYITHERTQPNHTVLTFNDMRQAIVDIFELLDKYFLLVKGGTMSNLVPNEQSNWLMPFTVPWLRPRVQDAPRFNSLEDMRTKQVNGPGHR